MLTIYSATCTRDGNPCHECRKLKQQLPIACIQDRISQGVPESTPYKYLGMRRLIELLRRKDRQINELKLGSLNRNHKLEVLTTSNLDYKRFAMAVSQCNVPHINILVQSALRNKHGIRGIIQLLTRATLGTYRPAYTEEEHLISIVLYRLGGARVAEFAHAALGTPGLTTVRKHCITSILASAVFPKLDELTRNIESAYEHCTLTGKGRVGLVCMFDEIKVKEGLDWCPWTNSVIGLCREHSSSCPYTFHNLDDAQVICEELSEKRIHLGTEATVGAIGALTKSHQEYIARPFLISATCKSETAEQHADLLRLAWGACKEETSLIGGRVYCLASNGESRCGKALVALTEKSPLSAFSPIYPLLHDLHLLNMMVGDDDITSDKDYKHVMKRLRHAHLHPKGIRVGSTQITPSLLRRQLESASIPINRINNLLNVADKQDVTTMINLMQLIWSLSPPSSTDNPIHRQDRTALNRHSKLLRWLILPYINVELSLHDQLKCLSAAAHVAYVFFMHENMRSAYIPAALYRDIQIMVKNAYFCVAKAKLEDPDGKFFIVLLGTDRLEWIFGFIRAENGYNVNVSTYSLSNRVSGAVECHAILSQHLEWDRGPCRLRLQGISDTAGVEQKVDHINPASWKGNVHLANVHLASAWKAG
ncbi:uncharacterized protein EI90DRAFT_2940187, partial [Cantharellus anzutake]|uniref:uncharacterized protein n=1 Tax=Cantharellus anzutake TaxID=1750568 RepID=UPI0019059E7D